MKCGNQQLEGFDKVLLTRGWMFRVMLNQYPLNISASAPEQPTVGTKWTLWLQKLSDLVYQTHKPTGSTNSLNSSPRSLKNITFASSGAALVSAADFKM